MTKMYTKICKVCMKEFVSDKPQRVCCSVECSEENKLATAREYQRRIRAAGLRKDIKKNTKKPKNTSIVDMAVKAKAAGMSYGQYVGMMAMKGMT